MTQQPVMKNETSQQMNSSQQKQKNWANQGKPNSAGAAPEQTPARYNAYERNKDYYEDEE